MLFEAENYRQFLSEELVRRMKANPRYSQRAFARQLAMSAGELSEILRGKRSLSLKSSLKIARALGLNESERKHLTYLIQVEKSETMAGDRKGGHSRDPNRNQLSLDMFALVSEWYCFAILNLVDCEGFRWDAGWIARRLGISPSEARVAVERLKRVGLIESYNGKWKVSKDYVMSPEGIPSEAIRNYHQQILSKAKQAIDLQSVEDRDVSGITFASQPKRLPMLKKEIARFLDEMASKYGSGKGQEVYQLELALFRLTGVNHAN